MTRRWILSGKGEDPHKSSAIRKAPLDTKACPFNEKAKKKKLASRDATPVKAKSVAVEQQHSTTSEASSSSAPRSSCAHAETSKPEEEEPEPTPKAPETALVAPCPATVGNSKFRSRPKVAQSSSSCSSADTGDAAKGTKLMRAAAPGTIIDQVMAVSRGFLRTNYFKGTPGNGGKLTSGPKTLSNTRCQIVVVRTNPLFTRIPVHISYQTLNAETLIRKPPR